MPPPSRKSFRRVWAALAVGLAVCAGGCVERRMTIRSNPPGALVYIDDYQIGVTPVSTNFTYYGTRKIRLVKDGFETLTVMQPIAPPWYEIVPIDFVSENLVPGQIRDHRTLDFQLTPQTLVLTEDLLERAEGLRGRTHDSGVVQSGPVAPRQPTFPPPGASPPPVVPGPPAGTGGTVPYPLEPPGGWRPR